LLARVGDGLYILRVLREIIGITPDRRDTTVWASDEVIHAPEIAVTDVRVDAVTEARGTGTP
jgi:hypothetical protein